MSQKDRMDAYYRRTIDLIMKHGWAIQGVFPTTDSPGVTFHYTVGLSWKGLPEFITFGLGLDAGEVILNDVVKRAVAGEPMQHGTILEGVVANGYKGVLLNVQNDSEHPLSMAHSMLRLHNSKGGRAMDTTSKARALQLVFQDKFYRWPGDPGYADTQLPILGELPTITKEN